MTINPSAYVSSSNAANAAGTTAVQNSGLSGMDSNAFMTLLMAQLRHQNPLEPMDEKEMMGQVTSLNSLQELQSIKNSMEMMRASSEILYASSLIGKTVKAKLADGKELEGIVDGISQSNGDIWVQIGEQKIALSTVMEVRGGSA